MSFLKRIEAHGFKSFADDLKIEFNSNIVGIVGPNGSGKSNINDAIRWVLGEQSVKSLRADNNDDIIFNGAQGKMPLNKAQVTLVFDNTNKIFNSPLNEIQITRKVYRNNSENKYYINKTRVRLKDVQNLVMDTGLSKGSLAIISQGNVSKFADSKPEERRHLFEEASGVAKYKKRKEESLRKLDRTNENLIRVSDIFNEMARKIEPLAKQAAKAKKYLEISSNLKQHEISLLIKDGNQAQDKLEKILQTIKINDKKQTVLKLDIDSHEKKIKDLKNRNYDLEKNINSLEMNLSNTNTLLGVLEQQKKSLEADLANNNEEKKVSEIELLKKNIQTLISEISFKKDIKNKEVQELKKLEITLSDLNLQKNIQTKALNELHHNLGKKKANLEFFHLQQQKYKQKNLGVQTVLDNRHILYGIIDTIANLIEVPELYQQAISIILGNNLNNIVAKTDKDVTKAVWFLKQNQAGIATFLPLNTIQVRKVSKEDLIIVSSEQGFVDFANNLVKVITTKENCQLAIDFLLARTIVCKTLESAQAVSNLIGARYQCISLDGQLIKAGGAIVGGFRNKSSIDNTFKKENNLKELSLEIKSLEEKLNTFNFQLSELQINIHNIQTQIARSEVIGAKEDYEISKLENQSQLLSTQYQNLTGKKLILKNNQKLDDIYSQYETNKYQQETLNLQLQQLRKKKHQIIEEIQNLENEVYSYHKQEYIVTNTLNNDKLQQVHLENKLDQIFKRLSQAYQLTFERAKELYHEQIIENEEESRNLVLKLRSNLEELGFVNVDAIQEYEIENERYLSLKTKHEELTSAVKELLKVIDELDKIMITKFDDTIRAINEVLPDTFAILFGGGNCQLKYNQPDNILETGIEVLANPPGKKISNLNLLSGGEKSLVALAVLFAILKIKPLPLTILDEVEAPLDPANLERFARYVRNFSSKTQFIIVTHRPATMENCDVLYGATMENQGVTKMVNIKLSQANKKFVNNSLKTARLG